MKVYPFIVCYIYAVLQQIQEQFCLDLEINVLLIKFRHSTLLPSDFRGSILWMLSSFQSHVNSNLKWQKSYMFCMESDG